MSFGCRHIPPIVTFFSAFVVSAMEYPLLNKFVQYPTSKSLYIGLLIASFDHVAEQCKHSLVIGYGLITIQLNLADCYDPNCLKWPGGWREATSKPILTHL